MNGERRDRLDGILEKLIEHSPEFEDDNGKGILLGNTRIYVKDGILKAMAAVSVVAISALAYFLYESRAIERIEAVLGR